MNPTLAFPALLAALASCALLGCDQDLAEPAPCPAPAIAVVVDGDLWCAHHDVARFDCPADKPIRHSVRGVAFCGARQADDGLGSVVARAALRTGEVLEQRDIFGFDVPPEWRTAPGAPRDVPLDVEVRTWIPSNKSWATADGDAFLCTRRFERFEVEPDGPGRLRVTAWDRLRCGPDEVGMGAEIEETHPLTLPGLAPGLHRLGGLGHTHAAEPTTIAVDLDALCPEPQPIDACFRGQLFAECGAAEGIEPAIWCAPAPRQHHCVWATCPPADFGIRDCGDDLYCPNPHAGWGPEPWSRARDMALDVVIDGAMDETEAELGCSSVPWSERICRPEVDAWRVDRSPGGSATWGWPSLMRLQVWPADEGLGEGWSLMVEVDVFAADGPTARACLVSYSDGGTSGEPVCADWGRVTLDRLPESADDVGAVRATVSARFPDFALDPLCETPCTVQGLEIDARL